MNPNDAPAKIMDQAEWAKVVDAANKEGEVTVYGVLNAKSVELLPVAFAKDYPNIKLTYARLSASDVTARLDAEIASGNTGADAVDNLDHPTFDGYAAKGALMPLTVPALGESAFDRSEFQRTPYVATFANSPWAWAWNTKVVPKGITSWSDFLTMDPSQVGGIDPSVAPTMASVYQETETPGAGGSGYLDKLMAKSKPRTYSSASQLAAALAAGEVSATLPIPVAAVATVKATGAPIDYRLPPNAPTNPAEVAIVTSAKHPNAAQVYANWLLGKSGQAVVAQAGLLAVRADTPQTIQTGGATLAEIPQITTDQFKAFMQRWNQLIAK